MATTPKTLSITLVAAGALLLAGIATGCGGTKKQTAGQDSTSAPAATQVTVQQTPASAEPQVKVETPRTKVDPCTLLTKAEAAAALGEAAKDGEYPKQVVVDPLGISSCLFGAVAPASIGLVQVQLIQNGSMDEKTRKHGMTAKRIFEEARKLSDGSARPVAGVGDEAMLEGFDIRVLKGDSHLYISLMRRGMAPGTASATPETDAALTAMARAAVERLGR